MASRTFTSWNRIAGWLRRIEAPRGAARTFMTHAGGCHRYMIAGREISSLPSVRSRAISHPASARASSTRTRGTRARSWTMRRVTVPANAVLATRHRDALVRVFGGRPPSRPLAREARAFASLRVAPDPQVGRAGARDWFLRKSSKPKFDQLEPARGMAASSRPSATSCLNLRGSGSSGQ